MSQSTVMSLVTIWQWLRLHLNCSVLSLMSFVSTGTSDSTYLTSSGCRVIRSSVTSFVRLSGERYTSKFAVFLCLKMRVLIAAWLWLWDILQAWLCEGSNCKPAKILFSASRFFKMCIPVAVHHTERHMIIFGLSVISRCFPQFKCWSITNACNNWRRRWSLWTSLTSTIWFLHKGRTSWLTRSASCLKDRSENRRKVFRHGCSVHIESHTHPCTHTTCPHIHICDCCLTDLFFSTHHFSSFDECCTVWFPARWMYGVEWLQSVVAHVDFSDGQIQIAIWFKSWFNSSRDLSWPRRDLIW